MILFELLVLPPFPVDVAGITAIYGVMRSLLLVCFLSCLLCLGCKKKSTAADPILGCWEVDIAAMQSLFGDRMNEKAKQTFQTMHLKIEPSQIVRYDIDVGFPSVPKMTARREGDLIYCTSDSARKELLQQSETCFQIKDADTILQMAGPNLSKPGFHYKRISEGEFKKRMKAAGARLFSEAEMEKVMKSMKDAAQGR